MPVTNPVVIAAFRSPPDADAARGALQAEGIDADIRDRAEALPRLDAGAFLFGSYLLVDAGDADAAMRVLHRLWPDEPLPARDAPRCPACGSPAIARLPRLALFAAAVLVLFAIGELTGQRELFLLVMVIAGVLLAIAPGRRCRVCGERWRGGGGPPLADTPVEGAEVTCPNCGSDETEAIPRRREKALTLLVTLALPPLVLIWPFLPRLRCGICLHEWW